DIVVHHLVVVPDRKPGKGSVRGLQVGIALVELVAVAEFLERRRNSDAVLADVVRSPGFLIDVVAEMHDEAEIACGHVAVGGKVALLVLLAGCESKTERPRRPGGCGSGASDRAERRTGAEA